MDHTSLKDMEYTVFARSFCGKNMHNVIFVEVEYIACEKNFSYGTFNISLYITKVQLTYNEEAYHFRLYVVGDCFKFK